MRRTLQIVELQTRVQQGDARAAKELRRRLKPIIACFVRRAFYLDGEGSCIESLLRAEVGAICLSRVNEIMAEDRRLVAQIVARVCNSLIDLLRLGRGP